MKHHQSVGPLAAGEVEFFEREGYLVVRDLFSDRELEPVIKAISGEIDRRAAEFVAQGKLSRTYEEYGFEERLAQINAENKQFPKTIWDYQVVLPEFFDLMTNKKLLDVAEQFCGEELIASSVYRLRPKVPSHKWSPVPWHQDWGYLEPYCDPATILTFWVPLVDATEENGCLWLTPGMHKGPILPHHPDDRKHYLVIEESEFGGRAPECVPVPKGGVLMFHNRTPHCSYENKTNKVRWSMDLRYQAASLPTNAQISRLPGESLPSPEDGVPVACHPPEPDFLVRSRLRPDEVMKTQQAFIDLRKNHVPVEITDRWGFTTSGRPDKI